EIKAASEVHALLTEQTHEPELDIASDPTPLEGDARAVGLLQRGYAAIRAQLEEKHYATAVGQLEALPSRLRQGGGPGWALLETYVRYKAGHYDGAIDCAEELLRAQPDFVREHNQLYYFLARSHKAEQHWGQAVSYMQTYAAGLAP